MLTLGDGVQAHPSLVVTVAGAAVTAAPITGYLTLVLSDVTDSTFVMDAIPGNVVRPPPSIVALSGACLCAAHGLSKTGVSQQHPCCRHHAGTCRAHQPRLQAVRALPVCSTCAQGKA